MNAIAKAVPNMTLTPFKGVAIRFATDADVDGIMWNLGFMARENSPLTVNMGKVRRAVVESISNSAAFVVEKGGKIVGCCSLFLSDMWYADQQVLTDYFFFVHPAHRDYRIAKCLLDECKQAAKVIGVPLVIGVMVKKDPIRKLKFFQRHMTPLGGFFISGH